MGDQTEHVAVEEWKAAKSAQEAAEHEDNRKETAQGQIKRLKKKRKEDAHWAAKHPQELAMIKNIPGASAAMTEIPKQHNWRKWLPDDAKGTIGSIARQTGMPLGKALQPEVQATLATIASSPLPGSLSRKPPPPLDPSCQPPTCFPPVLTRDPRLRSSGLRIEL